VGKEIHMLELSENDLAMIVGGNDDGGDGGDGDGGGEPAWTCGFAPSDSGGFDMLCIGPYGDDVMDNAGICRDEDVACFI
jgi:hypothetical protein